MVSASINGEQLEGAHSAVQHELEKPLGLFWLFRPSTADITIRYTTSSLLSKMWWKN